MCYRGVVYALTRRRIVLAAGMLLSVACGGGPASKDASASDAAVVTLDPVLYSGVKNVTAMTAGPDGNVWLSTSDGTIARTTMAGETEVFPVGLWQTGYTSLVRGPDGYLWLGNIDCFECSLARVATDGTVAEVLVDHNLRPVKRLTNAADGTVWFAGGDLFRGGGLARVTAAGIEHARVLTPVDCSEDGFVDGLGIDPDGNAWLTLLGYDCDELVRVTPTGQTTKHSINTAHVTDVAPPDLLVIGSDGNVWFTEGSGIVRMTPSGSSSWFRTGLSEWQGDITDVALGPDGNVWFSAYRRSRIGRLSPSGVVTHFDLPDGLIPQRFAAEPDGNLWLATQDGRIARVSL